MSVRSLIGVLGGIVIISFLAQLLELPLVNALASGTDRRHERISGRPEPAADPRRAAGHCRSHRRCLPGTWWRRSRASTRCQHAAVRCRAADSCCSSGASRNEAAAAALPTWVQVGARRRHRARDAAGRGRPRARGHTESGVERGGIVRLAYQGEPGAYSEAAARLYSPHADTLPCKTLRRRVRRGAAEARDARHRAAGELDRRHHPPQLRPAGRARAPDHRRSGARRRALPAGAARHDARRT